MGRIWWSPVREVVRGREASGCRGARRVLTGRVWRRGQWRGSRRAQEPEQGGRRCVHSSKPGNDAWSSRRRSSLSATPHAANHFALLVPDKSEPRSRHSSPFSFVSPLAPSPSRLAAAAGRRTLARASRSDSSAGVRAPALPREPCSSSESGAASERRGGGRARKRARASAPLRLELLLASLNDA